MLAAEQILKRNLEPVLDKYDFILFDRSPSLGMLTINALTAARELLIPMSMVRGLDMLARTFTKIHEMTNPELSYSSILAAKRDRRFSNSPRFLCDNHFSSGSWSLKRSPAKKTE
jgi:chromosome partitioning protein